MNPSAKELIEILERVLRDDLSCDEARLLIATGQMAFPGSEKIAPLLEHYWDDEDIRKRDSDYCSMQQVELSKLIQRLRDADFSAAASTSFLCPSPRNGSRSQSQGEQAEDPKPDHVPS